MAINYLKICLLIKHELIKGNLKRTAPGETNYQSILLWVNVRPMEHLKYPKAGISDKNSSLPIKFASHFWQTLFCWNWKYVEYFGWIPFIPQQHTFHMNSILPEREKESWNKRRHLLKCVLPRRRRRGKRFMGGFQGNLTWALSCQSQDDEGVLMC